MIYTELQSVLASVVASLGTLAPAHREIAYCSSTPDCSEYVQVSSPAFRFVSGPNQQGVQNKCAALMEMDVLIRVAIGCVPTLDDRGNLPSAVRVQTANERAYGLRERLAIAVAQIDDGFCSYKTFPTITCAIEGTSFVAQASYTKQVDCLNADVVIPGPCAGCA